MRVDVDQRAEVVIEIHRRAHGGRAVVFHRLRDGGSHVPVARGEIQKGMPFAWGARGERPMRERRELLFSGSDGSQLLQDIKGILPRAVEIGGDPDAQSLGVVGSRQPAFDILKRIAQRGQRVGFSVGIAAGSCVDGFVRPPVPVVVVGIGERGVVGIAQSAIVRADRRIVVGHRPPQAGNGRGGVAHVHAQGPCAEVVVALGSEGILILGGGFDCVDRALIVFKIMPHVERRVVGVRPRAEARQWQGLRFERPLDGIAKNHVGIHSGSPSALADQGLERCMVDEPPLAVVFHQQIRAGIVQGKNLRVARLHAPRGVRPPVGVVGRYSQGDFLRAPRHLPRQHAAGDVGDQPVVGLFAQGVAYPPVGEAGVGHVHAHGVGDGEIPAGGSVALSCE